ncbi:MAG TPA: CDP-alcohol phosphatidyltransferase family protein [candidate division Zixibacteria bacterium]|nr:CDP-alcohol phosphatidyltransferase family protein [candidate division Zixibacteria bacterium]
MSNTKLTQKKIIEPPYFSNWADLFMPKIANMILPLVSKFKWITPNMVTLVSFFIYASGCLFIFIDIQYHLYFTAILLPIAYIGDCLDGQLARTKNLFSDMGNYLDKVVDVLKIYMITISLSYSAYITTNHAIYIFLGFTACFRYYIKLETIFSQFNQDPQYLVKASERKQELYLSKQREYEKLSASFLGRIKLFWLKNRSIFWVDEAEFVLFTSIGAIFNRIELVLWILAVSQTLIAFWRLFERGYQTHKAKEKLLDPMRK